MPLIDLQSSPPSNGYLSPDALSKPEKWYPLRVFVCTSCWLVQTEDYAHFAELFDQDYAYFSSTSSSWVSHAEHYVTETTARFGLGSGSKVVEVASNDGYLLQFMRQRRIPCLGIEPTRSTASAARQKGLEILEEFFGAPLARTLVEQGQAADLTVANNVLAHVPDINDFVQAFSVLLKPTGVATFEFPHLMQMVLQSQFDTVYHEHFSYLSLTAVRNVFEANGLSIFDVEELSTHGGSLRVFAQRRDAGTRSPSASVAALLDTEARIGVTSPAFYAGFQQRANAIKDDFVRFLIDAKRDGKRLGAYGAAAKGNTLLNYAGVRQDLLPWVVDRAASKAGKFMPGSRIPIVDEERLIAERPDHVVIFPWNLGPEITRQLSYIREWGGTFVTFIPRLTLS